MSSYFVSFTGTKLHKNFGISAELQQINATGFDN